MTRRLLLSYLTISAFTLLVLGIPLGINFAHNERSALTTDLERDATVIATLVEESLEEGTGPDPVTIAADYQDRTGARVVVVDADGISVADSDDPAANRRDFSTRPEFEQALAGDRVSGTRYSETLGERILFVAVPVASAGEVHGAVRVTRETAEVDARIRRNWLTLGLIGLIVLAAVSVVGFLLARSVTQPVRALDAAAVAIAAGDLSARAEVDRGPPEVRSLARQFNRTAARLEELVSSQRAFVADASHQLRTPLTALRLRLENLGAGAPDSGRDDLDAAVGEATRLSRLVEGLLTITRAEGTRPERVTVDAAAVARERADAWEALAEERGARIDVDAPASAGALAVEGGLEQVLDNLLDNALDVAPPGSVITVRVERDHDAVTIHVVDQGPGMSAQDRARALDRFWRGGSARSGGSGLGLAIVDQLVTAGGGTVDLRAAEPSGLDVAVRLRAAAPPSRAN